MLASAVAIYFILAYVVLPFAWTHYERQPGLANLPMRTATADGIPGDPINVGFVGPRDTVLRAFAKAGWSPADAITLRSSIDIAASVVLDLPDTTAPVSPLFYDGRKQDLAFEKQQGASADRRHHIRLWKVMDSGAEGRPVWLASATFDRGVGVSHYTGQITHHIAADVDAERDNVIADLTRAGAVTSVYEVSGSGATLNGRNGGGDRFFTDGEVKMAVLNENLAAPPAAVAVIAPPAYVARKRTLLGLLRPLADWLP
ncbi:MAG: LssY C-terminal domain-containing protein [Beijerinckiaceae bacterium]|nr:LssY C-terminal domain-containing protein [Beijerinckiaceae bacterium]